MHIHTCTALDTPQLYIVCQRNSNSFDVESYIRKLVCRMKKKNTTWNMATLCYGCFSAFSQSFHRATKGRRKHATNISRQQKNNESYVLHIRASNWRKIKSKIKVNVSVFANSKMLFFWHFMPDRCACECMCGVPTDWVRIFWLHRITRDRIHIFFKSPELNV